MNISILPRVFPVRYAEWGKVLFSTGDGATDFRLLAYSNSDVATFTEHIYRGNLDNIDIPDHKLSTGRVTVALTYLNDHYIYTQIQQRTEGEVVNSSSDFQAHRHRPFNQVRFTQLTPEQIVDSFRQKLGLYTSLLYQNSHYPREARLRDFVSHSEELLEVLREGDVNCDLQVNQPAKPILEQLAKSIANFYFNLVRDSTDGFASQSYIVIKSGLTLMEKLQVLDTAQYLMYPMFGVLSFATDYIQTIPISFYLLDKLPSVSLDPNTQVIEENELRQFASAAYSNAARKLEAEQLFHPTLKYYLVRTSEPELAINLFRLVNTNVKFSDAKVFELLQNNHRILNQEDRQSIYSNRLSPEKLRRLLVHSNTSPRLRMEILRWAQKWSGERLSRYIPFHLDALESFGKEDIDARALRSLLQTVVRHSSEEEISHFDSRRRVQIYQELMLTDYEARERSNPDIPGQPLCFEHSAQSRDATQLSVTQILLNRMESDEFILLENIWSKYREFLSQDVYALLTLPNVRPWSVQRALSFWQTFPTQLPETFLIFLKYTVSHRPDYILLADQAVQFRKFLETGNSILERPDEQPTGLFVKLPLDLATLLRVACLEVCKPRSKENTQFAIWWLLSELPYAGEQIFQEDYTHLLDTYQSSAGIRQDGLLPEGLFLLTNGHMAKHLSLRKCSRLLNNNRLLDETNETLYEWILHTWLVRKIPLTTISITELVDLLPESDDILVQIVKNEDPRQVEMFIDLDAEVALAWLQKTKSKRQEYLSVDGDDLLFERLIHIHQPSVQLIRFMLIEDPGAYPARFEGVWESYAQRATQIYQEHWAKKCPNAEIEDYLRLANLFHDNGKSKYPEKNRHFLNHMILTEGISQSFKLEEADIRRMLIYAFTETESLFLQRIKLLITTYLERPDRDDLIKQLSPDTLNILQKYLFDHPSIQQYRKMIVDELNQKGFRVADSQDAVDLPTPNRTELGGMSNPKVPNPDHENSNKPKDIHHIQYDAPVSKTSNSSYKSKPVTSNLQNSSIGNNIPRNQEAFWDLVIWMIVILVLIFLLWEIFAPQIRFFFRTILDTYFLWR